MIGVLLRIGGQPLLQVGVVGVDGNPALGFIKKRFPWFSAAWLVLFAFLLLSALHFTRVAFFGDFLWLLNWGKRRFSNRNFHP